MKILLATNNAGKVERFKKLLSHVDRNMEVYTPKEVGLEIIDVEETGKTLLENAELKARAYWGKIDMPILANDTGFWVEGDGFVAAPKRTALEGMSEHALTPEALSKKQLEFWKSVATKHGGKVDAAWIETFVALYPDGTLKSAESRRDILLTDQEFGPAHPQMPVRALYYSKATDKAAALHTEEEEVLEMKPVIDALAPVLGI